VLRRGICENKMIKAEFFDIFGIAVFVILLYIGIKFSKYKLKGIKTSGYILIIISILGLIVDLYNVIYNYLLK